jgi:transposase
MLTLPSNVRVVVAAKPVDLRRGQDGLSAIVRNQWGLNPFEGHLFVFLGRRLDRVKILVWDRNGFVLYYKRLSRGRFRMPLIEQGAVRVVMDGTSLAMLLDGIDVGKVARPKAWSTPRVGSFLESRKSQKGEEKTIDKFVEM